ncbi:MAG: DUF167 domain-containing protein [Candidatus Micrarchaeia archaeon]|jgi:uncharacterized protein (TIGR00251 family)
MITIKAVPNAKGFSIKLQGDALPVVRLKSKAQEGEANRELEKRLSEITGAKCAVVRGHKSREKQVAFFGATDKQVLESLKAFSEKREKLK